MAREKDKRDVVERFLDDEFTNAFDETLSETRDINTPELYIDNQKPVDIIQFVEDPYYLGDPDLKLQKNVKQVLWDVEDPSVREADLEVGKGCLPKGTPVYDPSYGPRPIGEGGNYPIVGSNNGRAVVASFEREVHAGMKKCLKITTDCGSVIVTSEDHKFNTQAGKSQAKDLVVGSLIKAVGALPSVPSGRPVTEEDTWKVRRSIQLGGSLPQFCWTTTIDDLRYIVRDVADLVGFSTFERDQFQFTARHTAEDFRLLLLRDGIATSIADSSTGALFWVQCYTPEDSNRLQSILQKEPVQPLEDCNYVVLERVVSVEPAGEHDCYDILESSAENNFVSGTLLLSNSGKCLPVGTPVFDPVYGGPRQLQAGEDWFVAGLDRSSITPARTGGVRLTGTRDCVSLSTAYGSSLEASVDHRVLTPKGWVRAEDLRSGDLVAAPGTLPNLGTYNPTDTEVARLRKGLLEDLEAGLSRDYWLLSPSSLTKIIGSAYPMNFHAKTYRAAQEIRMLLLKNGRFSTIKGSRYLGYVVSPVTHAISGTGGLVWETVTEVTPTGPKLCADVFDSSGEHAFVAGTLVTHNSELGSIIPVYGAYVLSRMKRPQKFFGVSPSTILCAVNVSISGPQAKNVVFQSMKHKITNSPYFQTLKPEVLSVEIKLPNNINLYCGHSGDKAFLGYATIRGVMDEVNYMFDTSNRAVAESLYGTLSGSMKTRFRSYYKLISISSMTQPNTWLHQRVMQAQKSGEPYVERLRNMKINPVSKFPDGRILMKVITDKDPSQAELAKALAENHQLSIVGVTSGNKQLADGTWETVVEVRPGNLVGL